MEYDFTPDCISITMSSTDPDSFTCELPQVGKHIFLQEKAPWVVVPDDGVERWGTEESAHLLKTEGDS